MDERAAVFTKVDGFVATALFNAVRNGGDNVSAVSLRRAQPAKNLHNGVQEKGKENQGGKGESWGQRAERGRETRRTYCELCIANIALDGDQRGANAPLSGA